MPTISPSSVASSVLEIERGSMSLESSASGENREKLSGLIHEIQQDQKISVIEPSLILNTVDPPVPAPKAPEHQIDTSKMTD